MMLGTSFLLVATLGLSLADNSVQFRGRYQMVTSSTLNWAAASKGQVPEFAVVAATTEVNVTTHEDGDGDKPEPVKVYVCRGLHGGGWFSGQLTTGSTNCLVGALGIAIKMDRYEVLQNVDNGAQLTWSKWDKFLGFPHGAIAVSDNAFVARRKVVHEDDNSLDGSPKSNLSHFVGQFHPRDGLGKISVITQGGTEAAFTDGEVLVETEPIRYELANIKYNKMRRKVLRQPVELATTVLRNPNSQRTVKLDSALAYDSKYSSSWGHVRAILKGLPTTIRGQNGAVINEIKWGLPEHEDRKDVYRVEYTLEPGTAVNVTLRGNHTESEVPYTAKLISIFEHLLPSERLISGSHRQVEMLDVLPDFGPVYFLANDSLVPTTTTTTTTTTSTTTSTTTTTTTTPKPTTFRVKTDDSTKRENQAGMLSDEGANKLSNNAFLASFSLLLTGLSVVFNLFT